MERAEGRDRAGPVRTGRYDDRITRAPHAQTISAESLRCEIIARRFREIESPPGVNDMTK